MLKDLLQTKYTVPKMPSSFFRKLQLNMILTGAEAKGWSN